MPMMPAPLPLGEPVPDFTTKTFEGEPLALSDYRGKYVLLDFWATWCGPCLYETPNLLPLYEEFGDDPRFEIIGLSLDDEPGAPKRYVEEKGMNWVHGFLGNWMQTDVPNKFKVGGIPAIMLIDPEGKLVAVELRGRAIRDAIEKALK